MKKYNLKRFLASLLAVLMLASVTGVSPAVFAEDDSLVKPSSSSEPIEVLIKSSFTDDEVSEALAKALLTNADAVDAQSLDWTYTCAVKGSYKNAINQTKYTEAREDTFSVLKSHEYVQKDYTYEVTGSGIFRKEWKADVTYVYPALKDNADGVYTLYLNGQPVYINKVAKLKSVINVVDTVDTVPEIAIPYNADGSVNNAKLHESIFKAVVTGTTPEGLTYDQLSYPDSFSEGEQTITISYAGDDDYNGTSANVTVKFVDGRNVAFTANAKPDSFNIGFVGNDVNVDATKQAVLKQLVTKVGDVELDKIKVEYMPSYLGVKTGTYKDFSELSTTDISYYKGIKTDIRLTYAGDATHKAFSAEFKDLNFADNRIPSVVALVDVANITYNMDASKMIEEIIKNAIDSANSTLPADYKASDFTVELKKVTTIGAGDLTTDIVTWVPIAGDDGPNLNAGDNQTIRVTFNGSKDYKPSETAEGTLNVAKANVKVNVKKLITMHAGDADLPEGSITLDPDDRKIDVYTIFAGVTSKIGGKVTTSVYLDLPDRFTNNKALTLVLDPLVEKIIGRSFTEILQEGITVGELRELAEAATSAAETLKPILKAVGIDIDSFLKVMELINNLPSIADDMVIAIGTPNHAGVYQAFAVTNSINYNTAFGTGTVLVLKNFTGVEIVKSDKLDDGKLTAKEAQDIHDGNDQLCTLQKDSKDLNKAAQKALHYRFTGINGGKLYSSHDMPVDPGKYIVTVSVRGGDFFAMPKTFVFTIVDDPAPEVTPNA